jgi:hypothetical protein
LTWVACECGCGWEGEDEVTQWLVEEAVVLGVRARDRANADADGGDVTPDLSPEERLLMERHAQFMATSRGAA